MKQAFTLLFNLLLFCCQQAFSQKVVQLHTFDLPDRQSGYLFAGDNFYLNKDTSYDVLSLSSGTSSKVNKPSQQQLQPGSTMGAIGSSVVFSAHDNQRVYIADNTTAEEMSGPTNSQQIATGKNAAYMLYLLAGEGFKMIAIDNQTHQPKKFWFTGEKANVKMAYYEKEDLLFFSDTTTPNTVALYVSDGTREGTVLLKELEESAEETIYNSFFLNNGNTIYFVNFTYLNADPSQYLSHVYQLSASAITDAGTFKDLRPYPRQNYIRNNALYGYNAKTRSIVKAEGGSYTTLLPSPDFVTFEGEFNSKVLFTVPSDSSMLGTVNSTLYETNGTAAGTRIIADRVDAFFNDGHTITVHDGVLYFMKRDDHSGAELFKYDGHRVSIVEDAIPGQEGLRHVRFYTYKGELYFAAQPSDNLEQLAIYRLSDDASTIQLSTYADMNGNGIKDAEEPYLPNQQFSLNEGSLTVFTNLDVTNVNLQEGTYTLSLEPANGWAVADKSSTSISLPADNGKSYSFGLTPEQLVTKVDASLMSDATRCGFPTPYILHYSNSGFTYASGAIKLKPEAKFRYESATPAPDRISGDTLIWQVADLGIGRKGKITLSFTMPGVEHMGDTLISELFANFTATNNETTHADTTTLQQILTCSYDPNDIQANPAGLGEEHLTLKKQALEYLIRFQNMGTDKAFNIVVQNELQQEFDMSSFQVIGSSHEMYSVVKGNQVSFHFDNIQLPDDKTDEPGSHGYILYSVKPTSGLPDNSILHNQAYIYFDYNPAIETNVAFNTLVDQLPVKAVLAVGHKLDMGGPAIFPNPADTFVEVAWPEEANHHTHYSFINSKGQVVLQAEYNTAAVHQIDVSALPPGLYLLKAVRADRVINKKIILH